MSADEYLVGLVLVVGSGMFCSWEEFGSVSGVKLRTDSRL